MKARYIRNIFLVIGIISGMAARVQAQAVNNKSGQCNRQAARACADAAQHRLKYYSYGIAGPSKQFIDGMKQHYNIQVVSVGCVVSNDILCYNSAADSIISKLYGTAAVNKIHRRQL